MNDNIKIIEKKRQDLIELKSELSKINDSKKLIEMLPDKSAYQLIYETNKNNLDYIALNYFGSLITYKDLFERIDILSQKLKEMGVNPGEHVLISELATPEGIIAFYACNKIGAVAHLINPLYGKEDLIKIINNNNIKKYIIMDIFYDKSMQEAISHTSIETVIYSSLKTSLPYGINMDNFKYELITMLKTVGSKFKNDPKAISWEEIVKKDESYISKVDKSYYASNADSAVAYTSGTTGTSKGVVATNKAFNSMAILEGITEDSFVDQDVIFVTLPTWIYYGLVNSIHNPLYFSLTIALNPLFNPKTVHKDMNRYHFNHWDTIPTYIDDMANNKKVEKMNLAMLKSVVTGGDYLPIQLQEKVNNLIKKNGGSIKIMQGYGASELLGSFCYTKGRDFTMGSVGVPMIGNKAKIVDTETGNELGQNQTGELYLFSPTLMSRYLNKPEETESVIFRDVDGLLWYKTGDLAHINENGEIFIDGRIRRIDMVKDENGMPAKLIPDKIKRVVEQISEIFRCEVVSVPDKKYLFKPVLYIQLVNGYKYDEQLEKTIYSTCSSLLPEYMCPKDIVVIEKFPLRPSQKIDYEKLRENYFERIQEEKNQKRLTKKM